MTRFAAWKLVALVAITAALTVGSVGLRGPQADAGSNGTVKIAWLFDTETVTWTAFIPALGVVNFAIIDGSVLWVVSEGDQVIDLAGDVVLSLYDGGQFVFWTFGPVNAANVFDTTEPEPPSQDPTFATFGDGTYEVGVDIEPGRYRSTTLGQFCVWERLSGFSGESDDILIRRNFGTHGIDHVLGASAIVDIKETDAGFSTDGCGTWTSDLSPVTASTTAPFSAGMYLVGIDISAGTWLAQDPDFCFWERLSGFSGHSDELIAIARVPQLSGWVTIGATDVGFRAYEVCGEWDFLFGLDDF